MVHVLILAHGAICAIFQNKLEAKRDDFCKQNMKASSDYCMALIQDIFCPLYEDVNQHGLLGNASPAENVAHKYNTPLTMLGDSRKLLIDCWFKKYIYLSLCLSEAFFPVVF